MKFFLLLALVFAAVWLFRGSRRRDPPGAPPPTPGMPTADDRAARESVVACLHCGLHLPQSEATSGEAGWFCGDAHRIAHDSVQPR
jgi:uncharacterized protein